jgi:autotransporter translocation and assembly factor TamB
MAISCVLLNVAAQWKLHLKALMHQENLSNVRNFGALLGSNIHLQDSFLARMAFPPFEFLCLTRQQHVPLWNAAGELASITQQGSAALAGPGLPELQVPSLATLLPQLPAQAAGDTLLGGANAAPQHSCATVHAVTERHCFG